MILLSIIQPIAIQCCFLAVIEMKMRDQTVSYNKTPHILDIAHLWYDIHVKNLRAGYHLLYCNQWYWSHSTL